MADTNGSYLVNGVWQGLADALKPTGNIATRFPEVNSFDLSGTTLPGQWLLTSCSKVFSWQEQKGYGQDGAYVYPMGDPLVKAEFEGKIWREEDITLFRTIRQKFLKKPSFQSNSAAVTAFSISHPELHALGVTSCVLEQVDALTQAQGGLWVSRIKVLQYRPPKIAAAKPNQAITGAKATVNTAIDAQIAKNEQFAAKAAALAGG